MDSRNSPLSLYLIGSLRNPRVPEVAKHLRSGGYDVFDDWYAAGPEADDYWQAYEKEKGNDFSAALKGYAAQHVFHFDLHHLHRCDGAVLLLPAGKSGHLEAGYILGTGKPAWILLDGEPDRYDVMYNFATDVVTNTEDLLDAIGKYEWRS